MFNVPLFLHIQYYDRSISYNRYLVPLLVSLQCALAEFIMRPDFVSCKLLPCNFPCEEERPGWKSKTCLLFLHWNSTSSLGRGLAVWQWNVGKQTFWIIAEHFWNWKMSINTTYQRAPVMHILKLWTGLYQMDVQAKLPLPFIISLAQLQRWKLFGKFILPCGGMNWCTQSF